MRSNFGLAGVTNKTTFVIILFLNIHGSMSENSSNFCWLYRIMLVEVREIERGRDIQCYNVGRSKRERERERER